MTEIVRPSSVILDEYCRYYSDFSKRKICQIFSRIIDLVCLGKILNIYIKNLYPKVNFQFDQLLNVSFHVWHNLSDDEKISLGTFIEQINNSNTHSDNNQVGRTKVWSIVLCWMHLQSTSSTCNYPLKRNMSITPYRIFLKDQRRQMRRKHSNMSMKEINQRLAKRWKHLSKRIKQTYKYRSNLAKKRFSQRLFEE